MSWIQRNGHWALMLVVAFVFLQSLFFKFTGSPETVHIFEVKLDPWGASLGFPACLHPAAFSRPRW